MEPLGNFTYEEWCKKRDCVKTESIAPKSSISNRSNVSDHDNTYHYVAMREPGPQDAVPVAYALYPQPGYTYLYPPQHAPVATPAAPAAPVAAPKQASEASYHHHYVAERVREKSVVATQPAEQQPIMKEHYFQPFSSAVPVAYAMPNYPVPAHPSSPKPEKERVWVGRTKKQVDDDNARVAHKEGVYKPNDIMPKGAKPDQLFWVIEPDNTNTLRNFRTIEEDLQPGKWKIDPRYGNAYFVRDKPEKK